VTVPVAGFGPTTSVGLTVRAESVGAEDGGGGGCVWVVQPESVRLAEVEPSLTVTTQSAGFAKEELSIRKAPLASARPVSAPPFTVSGALALAPDPSMRTEVPWRSALVIVVAANAGGATATVTATTAAARAAALREAFMLRLLCGAWD
jgi:hypothetical protein